MPDAYDHISLICRLKATQTKNKELESGERYVKKNLENVMNFLPVISNRLKSRRNLSRNKKN